MEKKVCFKDCLELMKQFSMKWLSLVKSFALSVVWTIKKHSIFYVSMLRHKTSTKYVLMFTYTIWRYTQNDLGWMKDELYVCVWGMCAYSSRCVCLHCILLYLLFSSIFKRRFVAAPYFISITLRNINQFEDSYAAVHAKQWDFLFYIPIDALNRFFSTVWVPRSVRTQAFKFVERMYPVNCHNNGRVISCRTLKIYCLLQARMHEFYCYRTIKPHDI